MLAILGNFEETFAGIVVFIANIGEETEDEAVRDQLGCAEGPTMKLGAMIQVVACTPEILGNVRCEPTAPAS